MGAAARQAIWGREKEERWLGPLLASPAPRGSWAVYRVNDDGRREMVRGLLDPDAARTLAGKMRDRCPDSDLEAGWNYLPAAGTKRAR